MDCIVRTNQEGSKVAREFLREKLDGLAEDIIGEKYQYPKIIKVVLHEKTTYLLKKPSFSPLNGTKNILNFQKCGEICLIF